MLKNLLMLSAFIVSINSIFAADAEKGKTLFAAKCVECHGENGLGNIEKKAPKIAGQYDWYIETQLALFKNKERNNPDMDPALSGLTESDFKDLSLYISQMKK